MDKTLYYKTRAVGPSTLENIKGRTMQLKSRLYSPDEIARLLGVDRSTVYRWMRAKRLLSVLWVNQGRVVRRVPGKYFREFCDRWYPKEVGFWNIRR